MKKLLLIYIIFINLISWFYMFVDKEKAKKGKWRVPEATLWKMSLLGGALGSWVGSVIFRHKTKHFQFKFGLPLLAIIQIILIVTVFNLFA